MPEAVTSAPAPAPFTMRGCAAYRWVVNSTMLSFPFQLVKRVLRANGLQAHGSLSHMVARHELEALAFVCRVFQQLREMWRVRVELFEESRNVWRVEAGFGQEGMIGDVVHFQHGAAFAGQDEDLAHHVFPAEVDAGIGLGVTFVLRGFHHLAEVGAVHEMIEHES